MRDPVLIIYVRFMLMTNDHSMRMWRVSSEIVEDSSPLGYDAIKFLPVYTVSKT
jgi:hypothetical protein